jgi:hypothetical protein
MNKQSRRGRGAWAVVAGAMAGVAAWSSVVAAQTAPAPPAGPTTAVLVNLTVKPDVDRAQLRATMPDEVRDTVKAYLDGKIQQWFARADGRGVVFIMNSTSVAEAKLVMDSLPLAKTGLANFEFTALTPLTPLRLLLADPAAPKGPQ